MNRLKNEEIVEQQKNSLLNYSMELSLLTRLLKGKQITEREYEKVKNKPMKEYKIISDLTAMVA